jgi:hypothetical protein
MPDGILAYCWQTKCHVMRRNIVKLRHFENEKAVPHSSCTNQMQPPQPMLRRQPYHQKAANWAPSQRPKHSRNFPGCCGKYRIIVASRHRTKNDKSMAGSE